MSVRPRGERADTWQLATRTDGVRVPFRAEGDGEVVLCVPGLGNSSRLFGTLPRTLARLGYRAIAYDPPGLGRAADTPARWTLETAMQDLHAVLDATRTERAILLGTSMGGKLALRFAHEAPRRVSRLELYGTEAIGSGHAHAVYAFFRSVFTHVPSEELGDALRPWLFGATFLKRKSTLVDDIARAFRPTENERRCTLAQIAAIESFDFAAMLSEIDVPARLHAGEEDVLVLLEDVETTAQQIPGARFVRIPTAGHSLLLENSTDCLRSLRS